MSHPGVRREKPRGRGGIMSDLLNHLVRWMSDGLRPGFPDDVPVRMWSWLEPQDPRSGSDRGRRTATLEAREQILRPPDCPVHGPLIYTLSGWKCRALTCNYAPKKEKEKAR